MHLQALCCVSRSYQCGDLRIETLRTYWHLGGVERVLHYRVRISFIHLLKHVVRRGFGKRREQHKLGACMMHLRNCMLLMDDEKRTSRSERNVHLESFCLNNMCT